MTSWADFVMSYGPWMEPAEGGPRPFLLGHNCSYKRDVLLAAGDELGSLLESETVFHYRLAAAGHGLYLEPRARVSHLNFSRWTVSLRVQFHSGRVYASSLREGWSTPRKAIYALASPLIPLVRFGRSLRLIRRPSHRDIVPTAVIPALALGILCDGAGQVLGHIAGVGKLGGEAVRLRVPPRRQRHCRRPAKPSRRSREPENQRCLTTPTPRSSAS